MKMNNLKLKIINENEQFKIENDIYHTKNDKLIIENNKLINENKKYKTKNDKLIDENNKLIDVNDKLIDVNDKLIKDILNLAYNNSGINQNYKKSSYNVSLTNEIEYSNPEYSLIVSNLYQIMANYYASDVKETKTYNDSYHHVSILFNVDSKFIYYALINVISALKTKYDDTFYDYHIFVPNTENKKILKYLKNIQKKISKAVSFTYYYINSEPVKIITKEIIAGLQQQVQDYYLQIF